MRVFAVIILVIALVMGVYAVYEIQSLKTEIKDLKEELKILKEEFKDLHTSAGKKEVLIYLVESTPIDFLLRPVIREVQEVASPQVALDELLAGPKPAEGLISPIPPGTCPRTPSKDGSTVIFLKKYTIILMVALLWNLSYLIRSFIHLRI